MYALIWRRIIATDVNTCAQSCFLSTAVVLSPDYTAVTWQCVYMSQHVCSFLWVSASCCACNNEEVQQSFVHNNALLNTYITTCFGLNPSHHHVFFIFTIYNLNFRILFYFFLINLQLYVSSHNNLRIYTYICFSSIDFSNR
jgi:hypothetical protein